MANVMGLCDDNFSYNAYNFHKKTNIVNKIQESNKVND